MEEKTYQFRIAGEFIGVENSNDDPEEEIFQAFFEEQNDEKEEAHIESNKPSRRVAFSLEVKTT